MHLSFFHFVSPFVSSLSLLLRFPVVGSRCITPVYYPFVGSKSSSLPSLGRSPRACRPQLWMINVLRYVSLFFSVSFHFLEFSNIFCTIVFIVVQWFYQGTLRWHIQAHSVRERWKLLLKLPFGWLGLSLLSTAKNEQQNLKTDCFT